MHARALASPPTHQRRGNGAGSEEPPIQGAAEALALGHEELGLGAHAGAGGPAGPTWRRREAAGKGQSAGLPGSLLVRHSRAVPPLYGCAWVCMHRHGRGAPNPPEEEEKPSFSFF